MKNKFSKKRSVYFSTYSVAENARRNYMPSSSTRESGVLS
jgi:hypothetical protein